MAKTDTTVVPSAEKEPKTEAKNAVEAIEEKKVEEAKLAEVQTATQVEHPPVPEVKMPEISKKKSVAEDKAEQSNTDDGADAAAAGDVPEAPANPKLNTKQIAKDLNANLMQIVREKGRSFHDARVILQYALTTLGRDWVNTRGKA